MCKPFSHTMNTAVHVAHPDGPPDGLHSNKVYDTAVGDRIHRTDRHFCNLNALQCPPVSRSTQSMQPVRRSSCLVGLVYRLRQALRRNPWNFFGRNRIFAESHRSIFGRKRNWPKQFKLLFSAPKPKPNFGRSLPKSYTSGMTEATVVKFCTHVGRFKLVVLE